MFRHLWDRITRTPAPRKGRPRRVAPRPQVEALESRYAPTVQIINFGPPQAPTQTSIIGNSENDAVTLVRQGVLQETQIFANGQFIATSFAPVIDFDGGAGINSLTLQGPGGDYNLLSNQPGGRGLIESPFGVNYFYRNAQSLQLDLLQSIPSDVDIFGTSPGVTTTVRTGAGADTVTVRGTGGALNLQTGAGDDTIRIGAQGAAPAIPLGVVVTVDGQGGADTLTYDDTANTTSTLLYTLNTFDNVTGVVSRNGLGDVRYRDVSQVTLNTAPGGMTVNVQNTLAVTPVTVNMGDGNDTVNLRGTAILPGGAVTVNAGGGNDTFNVGTQGQVPLLLATLNGGAGNDTVNFDATGFDSGNFQVFADRVTKDNAANVGYSGVEAMALNLSALNSTIFVESLAGTNLTVNAGGGNDALTVRMGALAPSASVNFNGGVGIDQLTLDDTADTSAGRQFIIGGGAVGRSGAGLVRYTTLESLVLNAGQGDDTITVNDTAGATTNVNGGAGDDGFFVAFQPSAQLFLNGGGGIDCLRADDSGHGVSRTYTVAATSLARGGAGTINYQGTEYVSLFTGVAAQTVQVNGTAAGVNTNVFGGPAFDTFRIGTGVSGPLRIQGGAGGNALDYTGRSTGVYVNLLTGEATGLASIADIRDVTGGLGNDILVGVGRGHQLRGGGGRDLLIAGGATFSVTPSFLDGGADQDILIGGFTDYDGDRLALQAIMADWSSNDFFFTRVSRLLQGTGGAPLLNATTVHSNHVGDTLVGLTDFDLFYAVPGLDNLIDADPEGDVVVVIA